MSFPARTQADRTADNVLELVHARARLDALDRLHQPDPRFPTDCAGCSDGCLYCESDHKLSDCKVRAILDGPAPTPTGAP